MNTEASSRAVRRILSGSSVAVIALGMVATTQGFAQHVHGVIDLGVVVEGDSLAVSLHAPLSDVVGFERAAETDEEADALREAAALLETADQMFGVPEAAGCKIDDVSLEGPDYLIPEAHDDVHAHEDDHHEEHDDHDEDHSDEHAGDHSHGDLDAQYVWRCMSPSQIGALEARFIAGFANVETIKIQIITPAGVRVLEGDSQLDSIAVSDP